MAINKNKVMEAAQKFVEKGQVDKAIKEYLKVVQEDPKDVRVWLKVGDLYAKKGAKAEATETYLKVAQFYGEQGFYLKAVAVYKQILKIEPRLVDVNLKLAEVYRQLGLLSDAMQQFELVAAHYHREGKTREALATIRDLVELDPENVATRIKLAELYSKEGMAAEAIAEFAKAADFLRAHSRMDDFIKVAERLVWHQPENHAINRELAQLYLKRNDPRRALQKLQACFKADPRDIETLSLLAQAFQALDQKPKTISVWKELARIHQENNQPQQANDVYRKILQLAPDDADALAAIGGVRKQTATNVPVLPQQGMPHGSPPPPAPAMQTPAPHPREPMPRVATPIAPPSRSGNQQAPPAQPPFLRESSILPTPGAERRRPTGSIPIVSFEPDPEPAPAITGSQAIRRSSGSVPTLGRDGRFDLDDDAQGGRGVNTGDTTSRRGADDVELELDDFGGGQDEVILGAGADPSEAHADEIAKILTETDVYTKYGLHQKAIEHLKKVFEIDARNSEAREKLKDVYIALGRNAEAATELVRLAEQTAPGNPRQAAAYLRELFAIAPGDARGQAVVTRHRLQVETDMGSDMEVEAELEVESGQPEMELDAGDEADIEVERASNGHMEPMEMDAEMEAEADLSVHASDLDAGVAVAADGEVGVEFDELGLDMPSGPVSTSMPARAGDMPGVAAATQHSADDGGMDFDLDELSATANPGELPPLRRESTQVVSDDQVEMAVADYEAEQEVEQDALAFDGGATRFDDASSRIAASEKMASEFDLGDGPEWDGPSAAAAPPVSSPAPARTSSSSSAARPVPAPAAPPSYDTSFDEFSAADLSPPSDEFSLENSPSTGVDAEAEAHAHGHPPEPLATTGDGGDEPTSGGSGSSLEDDLDEADFFVGQNLFNEAKDILDGLLTRYPNHPLVLAKLQDVQAMERAAGVEDDDGATHGDMSPPVELRPPSVAPAPAPAASANRPAVIARMGDSDADTHYDLGLAYKEMGLFDEAIKEFHLVRETPGRAVQCHLMIGLCHVERGKLSEAVTEFKNGLYVEGINERESLALYFELGVTYEALGDAREALYYYEKVSKRDPRFRDVAGRTEGVKAKVAASGDRRLSGDSTLDAASTGDDFSR